MGYVPWFLCNLSFYDRSYLIELWYVKVHNGLEIDINQFLHWMKLEPQSLVWISVFHRMIAAESAEHPIKCSVCKLFPIVGFR